MDDKGLPKIALRYPKVTWVLLGFFYALIAVLTAITLFVALFRDVDITGPGWAVVTIALTALGVFPYLVKKSVKEMQRVR